MVEGTDMQLMYGGDQMGMGGGQGGNYQQGPGQVPVNPSHFGGNGDQKSKRANKGDFGPNSVNASNGPRGQRQSPVIQRAGMNNVRGMGPWRSTQ